MSPLTLLPLFAVHGCFAGEAGVTGNPGKMTDREILYRQVWEISMRHLA